MYDVFFEKSISKNEYCWGLSFQKEIQYIFFEFEICVFENKVLYL